MVPPPLRLPARVARILDGRPVVSVFGASDAPRGGPHYLAAQRIGARIARGGGVVCTGGYTGIMEGASRGASEAGGDAIGIVTRAFPALEPNPWVTQVIRTEDLHVRMRRLLEIADAFLVFPGKAGTFSEIMLLWALLRAGMTPPGRPVVLTGRGWPPVLRGLLRARILDPGVLRDTRVVPAPDRAAESILRRLRRGTGAAR